MSRSVYKLAIIGACASCVGRAVANARHQARVIVNIAGRENVMTNFVCKYLQAKFLQFQLINQLQINHHGVVEQANRGETAAHAFAFERGFRSQPQWIGQFGETTPHGERVRPLFLPLQLR